MTASADIAQSTVLRWRGVDGAFYRVIEQDGATGERKTVASVDEPRAEIAVRPGCTYRIDIRPAGEKSFVALVPFADAAPEPAGALVFEAPDDGVAAAWRCVLRRGETVLADIVSMRPRIAVARVVAGEAPARFRLFGWHWREHRWVPCGPYAELGAPAAPRARVSAEKRPEASGPAPLVAMFTIDTEANLRLMRRPDRAGAVEHQIFGRSGGRELGIGLIMDQLDRRGIRGTFFLDILMEYQFGRAALERTIEAIAARGHDIQLHVHPSPHLAYAADETLFDACRILTQDSAPEQFARVLGLAVELFERRVGKAPIAFRNGAYHIHDSYFELFRTAGLRYDSTVYAFKNCRASPWIRGRVQPFEVLPGLWEIPLPWMIVNAPGGARSVSQYTARPGPLLDAAKAAYQLLAAQRTQGPIFVPLIMHSYTYLNEVRLDDDRAGADWNRDLLTQVPKGRFRNLRRDPKQECLFLEGADDARIAAVESQLDAIGAMDGARFRAFDELDATLFGAAHGAVEAVCEMDRDSGAGRLTALRRYGADLLRHHDEARPAERIVLARPAVLPETLGGARDAKPTLEWKDEPGALRYRVSQRNADTGQVRLLYHGPDAWFVLAEEDVKPGARYEYRVQVLVSGERYKTIIPYVPLESHRDAAAMRTVRCPDVSGATAYRIRLFDRMVEGVTVFVAARMIPVFPLPMFELPDARLRVTFYAFDGESGAWKNLGPDADLDDVLASEDA